MLTTDEKLQLLIEEAAEIIHAASKCLRFGFDVDHGTGYGNNRKKLSQELGDFRGIVDELDVDWDAYQGARMSKLPRVLENRKNYPRTDCD